MVHFFILLELAALLTLPALIIRMTRRHAVLRRIGAVTLCYTLGFLLSFLPLPCGRELLSTFVSILVALAIPLLLFGFDLAEVRTLARPMLLGFALIIVSVVTVSAAAAFVGSACGMERAAAFSGMAAALYIGGTPNLFAVGDALLHGDTAAINLANLADSVVGAVYLLLLLTVLRPLYLRAPHRREASPAAAQELPCEYDVRLLPHSRRDTLRLGGVILLAAFCLGVGVLAELLASGSLDGSLFIVLTVSVLGIVCSRSRSVRSVPGSYQVGSYLILVFSLGLGASVDFSALAPELLPTLAYFAAIQIASLALHLVLCRLFRIDGAATVLTGVAGIYGPPFIAPVANAYGARELIAPGVICGTLGLVVGNLFGLTLGALLARLL